MMFFLLLIIFYFFIFPSPIFAADQWASGSISSPRSGLIDSPFLSADGKRIYFTYAPVSFLDFISGTNIYPRGENLAGHIRDVAHENTADLYYIEWNGSFWSSPINLGPKINSLVIDCCAWLNPTETQIVFFRYGDAIRQGMTAFRADKNDSWGTPVILSGDYGTANMSDDVARSDLALGLVTGDVYLWEYRSPSVNSKGGRLMRGTWNGQTHSTPIGFDTPAWDKEAVDETQPWISPDEKTLLFNRRDSNGQTTLWRSARTSVTDLWNDPVQVAISGFADELNQMIWGEVSLTPNQDRLVAVRFNTTPIGWKSELITAPGTALSGFTNAVALNTGTPPVPVYLEGDLNKDGIVNSLDWSIMNSEWFEHNKPSDINGDTITNSLDRALMIRNWLLIP
jgi:hypothetical protein